VNDYSSHCHNAKVATQALYRAMTDKHYAQAGILIAAAEWELHHVREWIRKQEEQCTSKSK